MSRHEPDLVGVVEAAYALEAPQGEWLKRLLKAVRPSLDGGQGMFCSLYDAANPESLRLYDLIGSGIPKMTLELIRFAAQGARSEIIGRARWEICSTLSQAVGEEALDSIPALVAARAAFGVRDLLGLNAGDPTLHGCVFAAPLTESRPLTPAFQRTWSRIASHIAAGFRLRRQLEKITSQGVEGAEAVLDPGGKIEHVEGLAEGKAEREALRGAAVAIDRARTRKMRDSQPEEAVAQWEPLVCGRCRWWITSSATGGATWWRGRMIRSSPETS